MEFDPDGSADVVNVATPPLTAAVPRFVVPLLNVTSPRGVPAYCGDTVAVSVIACPRVDGFKDELNAVVVVACLINWLTAVDVLLAYVESPR